MLEEDFDEQMYLDNFSSYLLSILEDRTVWPDILLEREGTGEACMAMYAKHLAILGISWDWIECCKSCPSRVVPIPDPPKLLTFFFFTGDAGPDEKKQRKASVSAVFVSTTTSFAVDTDCIRHQIALAVKSCFFLSN